MTGIDWKDELSVGIDEIDEQHKRLTLIINRMGEAMADGRSEELIGSIIDELVAYADTHFATEEKYFVKYGYPKAAEHEAEHAAFDKQIKEYQKAYARGEISSCSEVLQYLIGWFTTHLKGADHEYAVYFREHGKL